MRLNGSAGLLLKETALGLGALGGFGLSALGAGGYGLSALGHEPWAVGTNAELVTHGKFVDR